MTDLSAKLERFARSGVAFTRKTYPNDGEEFAGYTLLEFALGWSIYDQNGTWVEHGINHCIATISDDLVRDAAFVSRSGQCPD